MSIIRADIENKICSLMRALEHFDDDDNIVIDRGGVSMYVGVGIFYGPAQVSKELERMWKKFYEEDNEVSKD